MGVRKSGVNGAVRGGGDTRYVSRRCASALFIDLSSPSVFHTHLDGRGGEDGEVALVGEDGCVGHHRQPGVVQVLFCFWFVCLGESRVGEG